MRVEIYWINDCLAIMPRPRGGDWLADEIESLKQQGVTTVVSLLEKDEIVELELHGEELLCREKKMKFLSYPIPDRQTPASLPKTAEFVGQLRDLLKQNEKIAIHCRQGVGRSSLIASCTLIDTANSVDKVFEQIAAARRCAVPDTLEQRKWVEQFSKLV